MSASWWRRREQTVQAPTSGPVPTPVTRARIAEYLDGEGYRHVLDRDGDLAATWNGHPFWLMVSGEREEVLQVRGRWAGTASLELRPALLLVVNDWNRDRFWPKAYLRLEDDALALYGEWSTDLEHGATDAQLGQLVDTAIGTTLQLFAQVETTLGPALEAPAED